MSWKVMWHLADVQAAVTRAVLTGDGDSAPASLIGGIDVRARLDIHLRHYQASLQTVLLDKFPATAWLLGSEIVAQAALDYLRRFPPQTPCMAEYGAEFPTFISQSKRALDLPYVGAFASLEWALGNASIATDLTPLPWSEVANAGSKGLLDARLELQPGLGYLRAAYGVDALMRLYLNDHEPDSFELPAGDTAIEVHGSRGELRMTRLDPGSFVFRDALCRGESISDAAGRALDAARGFDAGNALRELLAAELAIAIHL
jgi:hypothetical protein